MTLAGQLALALICTALILVGATIATGAWVAGHSRGYARRDWHRPMVACLGALAGGFAIAGCWFGAFS